MSLVNTTIKRDDNGSELVALVARQPIYTADLDLFGFELLYRSSVSANMAPRLLDGNTASSNVILNAFMDIGLDSITSDKHVFVKVTQPFLEGEIEIPFLPGNLVLQVAEKITPNTRVLDTLSKLKEKGYVIALDNYTFDKKATPFLEFADIVKMDIKQVDETSLPEEMQSLVARYGHRFLAKRIETEAEYSVCKFLGFELFQGFFMQKPAIIQRSKLPSNKLAILLLLQKLQDPNLQTDDLIALVKNDAGLSFKLLKYVNSPVFALSNKITSLKHAVLLLGLNVLKRWVNLIVLAGICDSRQDLVRMSLLRGRMCELIAEQMQFENKEEYFLLGLFSLLGAMLQQSLEDIIDELPVSEVMRDALLKRTGAMGGVLNAVIIYESGEWESLNMQTDEQMIYKRSYLEASEWSEKAMAGL